MLYDSVCLEHMEEEEDRVVPAPKGPHMLGPFRRLNLELGTTYIAEHCRLGVTVQVQALDPSASAGHDRIIRGIRVAQRYRKSRCFQKLLWITRRERTLFLVAEHPEDTLQSLIHRQGALSLKAAKRVFAQILVGVATLHHDQIVHRNLTLQTVVICGGLAKVSGFDHANAFEEEAQQALIKSSLGFCSPEVVRGSDITQYDRTKADMWSLGCILHALLVGRVPFEANTNTQVGEQICRGAASLTLPPHLEHGAASTIRALLADDPTNRPAAVELLRSPWLEYDYDGAVSSFMQRTPDTAIEHAMTLAGFPWDHVTASRADSEYSLPSAERFLASQKLSYNNHDIELECPAIVPSVETSPGRRDSIDSIGSVSHVDDATVPSVEWADCSSGGRSPIPESQLYSRYHRESEGSSLPMDCSTKSFQNYRWDHSTLLT